MKPDPIRGSAPKVWIAVGREPLSERTPSIDVEVIQNRAAWELRLHGGTCSQMCHFRVALRQDRLLLVVNLDEERAVAVLQASKKRSQTVVIVLSPVFARVVVAFRTADAHAHEELRHFLRAQQR